MSKEKQVLHILEVFMKKILRKKKAVICSKCKKPATRMRFTQIAGKHFFCEEHGRKKEEKDFNKKNPMVFVVWRIL